MRRMHHQRNRQSKRSRKNRKAHDILPAIHDGPLRQYFLQLSRRDHAAGKRERPDNHFQRNLAHLKPRDRRGAYVILGDADHRRRRRTEAWLKAVRAGHRGHMHQAQWDANSGADDQGDEDPLVLAASGLNSVTTTASAAPISPASTPSARFSANSGLQRKN